MFQEISNLNIGQFVTFRYWSGPYVKDIMGYQRWEKEFLTILKTIDQQKHSIFLCTYYSDTVPCDGFSSEEWLEITGTNFIKVDWFPFGWFPVGALNEGWCYQLDSMEAMLKFDFLSQEDLAVAFFLEPDMTLEQFQQALNRPRNYLDYVLASILSPNSVILKASPDEMWFDITVKR